MRAIISLHSFLSPISYDFTLTNACNHIFNRRLADVLDTLSTAQPSCPQLYIYSSADRVIPVEQVESFIVEQRKAGHEVRACNFISSPHVDHFRSNPELYTAELNHFMNNFVLSCCHHSS